MVTAPLHPFDPLTQLMMTGAAGDPALKEQIASYLASIGALPPAPTRGHWNAPSDPATPSDADSVIPPSPAGPRMPIYAQADPAQGLLGSLVNSVFGPSGQPPPVRGAGGGLAAGGVQGTTVAPDPRGPGGYQPVQAPGQYIPPPPGPQSQLGGGRTTGLPTGAPDAKPPSTVGITGSDGQSVQPGPQAPSLHPMIYPQSRGDSVRDSATFLGEEAPGRQPIDPKSVDATDVGQAGVGAGEKTQDPTDTGQKDPSKDMAKLESLSKVLGALGPPKQEDTRMAFPPLPGHESRFSPQDLMTMIAQLSQPGTRTAPSSLGQLIGGGFR